VNANIVIATLRTLKIIYQYDDVPSDVLFQVSSSLLYVNNSFVTKLCTVYLWLFMISNKFVACWEFQNTV